MANSERMTNLKKAAGCAVKILLQGDCNAASTGKILPDTRIAIIPFTQLVNVGPSNASQPWIDINGISPIANDNFDDDDNDTTPFTGQVNRLALYATIKNDDWRGCVEARPHIDDGDGAHLDTDDVTPATTNPTTLFVPQFAPDENSGFSNNYLNELSQPASCNRVGSCTWTETKTQCSSYSNCANNSVVTSTYSLSGPNVGTTACTCPSTGPFTSDSGTTTYTVTGNTRTYNRVRTCNFSYAPTGLSARELQERMCKYTGATLSATSNQQGPNTDCPYVPITPLTNSVINLQKTLSNMVASGGTNIHEGTAWGWRVLSPTAPFTEGAPYNTPLKNDTAKFMIIMTDGENTTYPASNMNGASIYSAYAYPYNNKPEGYRLGNPGTSQANLEKEIDNRLLETCTGAKRKGKDIVIYTIGLSSPESVKDLLRACASSPDKAKFPENASDLNEVFAGIAEELNQLRITQ
jgi:hypothetical protein